MEGFEFLRIEWLVDLAPMDFLRGNRVFHCEFVFRGAAGALTRPTHQRAISRQPRALTAPQRVLHQRSSVQIAIHIGPGDELVQGYNVWIAGRRLHGHEAFSSKRSRPAPW